MPVSRLQRQLTEKLILPKSLNEKVGAEMAQYGGENLSSWILQRTAALCSGIAASLALKRLALNVFPRNPTAIELMQRRNRRMASETSVHTGRNFDVRESDLFIATYAKCGTTWTQQIVHQLRSGGHMAFEEISQVVPWDILATDVGIDINGEQLFHPRAFKSHESWDTIAKGGRYIYVARDPKDAMLSFYKFLPAYAGIDDGEISIEEFVESIFAGASSSGIIWVHFLSWWKQRKNPQILWMFYEDLRNDLEKGVLRIAKFLNIQPDRRLLDLVVKRSTFSYMKSNQGQFDGHFVFHRVKKQMGMQGFPYKATKVNKARKIGESKVVIPTKILATLEAKWATILRPATGCTSYKELMNAVKADLPEYYDDRKLLAFFNKI